MDRRGDQIVETETEASGGSKEGVVRWVLVIGLVLAVVFLSIIWMTGALTQDDGADSETSVSNQIRQQEIDNSAGEPIAPDFDQSASDQVTQDGMLAVEPNPATEATDTAATDPTADTQ